MKKKFNNYINICNLLNKNYILLLCNFNKIKNIILKYLKKNINCKFLHSNNIYLYKHFNIKIKNCIDIIILKYNDKEFETTLKKIHYYLNIQPFFYIKKNLLLKNLPINILNLSQNNLISKFIEIIKQNILNFITILKKI
ncbi:putative ribosomal protein L10 [Candidatus Carsonella ruddii CS isolate Thao2000]|uniref:Putative ribosomal protein L10 n=1 Tax=Candidatus Carsonella ruddii CS isolate Thao2000 TaxID=1202537 RepID=J7GSV8_CARRU|nr:hypothetical protein [Candidatus Carsonella ruddii]AFP83837.1 putative ribosomal protein L10 [Candidatus Carsonella ruddii CS isolate Thao2000]